MLTASREQWKHKSEHSSNNEQVSAWLDKLNKESQPQNPTADVVKLSSFGEGQLPSVGEGVLPSVAESELPSVIEEVLSSVGQASVGEGELSLVSEGVLPSVTESELPSVIEEVLSSVGQASVGEGELSLVSEGVLPPVGEGELPSVSEGVLPPVGEGELPSVSEGEMPPVGEGELPSVGEGVLPPVGEGVLPPVGEGVLPSVSEGDMLAGMSADMDTSVIISSAHLLLYGLENVNSLSSNDPFLPASDMELAPAVVESVLSSGGEGELAPVNMLAGTSAEMDNSFIISSAQSLKYGLENLNPISSNEPLLPVSDTVLAPAVDESVLPSVGDRELDLPSGGSPFKSRKRASHRDNWKSVARKRARQNGLAYISHNGALVEGKKPVLDERLCNCRLRCDEKFTDAQRQALFDSFYTLDDNGKNVYIFKSLKPIAPKSLMLNAKTHRKSSFTYWVTSGTAECRVCKLAYRRLHQISNSKVFHIAQQVAAGLSVPKPDGRGRHDTRPHRCSEESLSFVKEHIRRFPSESSHYSRACNMSRQYLSPELTIEKMYKLYQQWCLERRIKSVSSRLYRDIFNKSFNLGFGLPKSDTCSTCDAAGSTDVEAHKLRAEQAMSAMKEDRKVAAEHDNIAYITFDMQKTLPLPKLSTSVAFYLRQLWLYNVGIHLVTKSEKQAYFNIWTEDIAGRGSDEVGSTLLAFFDAAHITASRLVAWSDSCSGQNKNFYILCIWQYLIGRRKFEIIDHKFPESGHSYMDSDRDFAQVEKLVRKRQNVYSVDDYHTILAQSQTKNPPQVTRVGSSMLSVKELPKLLGLRNASVNTIGTKVAFRDSVRWIRVSRFGQYQYKSRHSEDEEWKTVILSGNESSVADVVIPQKKQCHRVADAKIADIQKQLQFIPAQCRAYYDQVIFANSHNEDADEATLFQV